MSLGDSILLITTPLLARQKPTPRLLGAASPTIIHGPSDTITWDSYLPFGYGEQATWQLSEFTHVPTPFDPHPHNVIVKASVVVYMTWTENDGGHVGKFESDGSGAVQNLHRLQTVHATHPQGRTTRYMLTLKQWTKTGCAHDTLGPSTKLVRPFETSGNTRSAIIDCTDSDGDTDSLGHCPPGGASLVLSIRYYRPDEAPLPKISLPFSDNAADSDTDFVLGGVLRTTANSDYTMNADNRLIGTTVVHNETNVFGSSVTTRVRVSDRWDQAIPYVDASTTSPHRGEWKSAFPELNGGEQAKFGWYIQYPPGIEIGRIEVDHLF